MKISACLHSIFPHSFMFSPFTCLLSTAECNHHHHHLANMKLDHWLTSCGVARLEVSRHACPEAKGNNPATGLNCSGLATHSEGNSNYLQISLEEDENEVIRIMGIPVSCWIWNMFSYRQWITCNAVIAFLGFSSILNTPFVKMHTD